MSIFTHRQNTECGRREVRRLHGKRFKRYACRRVQSRCILVSMDSEYIVYIILILRISCEDYQRFPGQWLSLSGRLLIFGRNIRRPIYFLYVLYNLYNYTSPEIRNQFISSTRLPLHCTFYEKQTSALPCLLFTPFALESKAHALNKNANNIYRSFLIQFIPQTNNK